MFVRIDLHTAVTTNVHSHPEIYTVVFGPGFPIEDPGAFKITMQVPTARARQASLPVLSVTVMFLRVVLSVRMKS